MLHPRVVENQGNIVIKFAWVRPFYCDLSTDQESQKRALEGLSGLKSELEEKKNYVLSLQEQMQQQTLACSVCTGVGSFVIVHGISCKGTRAQTQLAAISFL